MGVARGSWLTASLFCKEVTGTAPKPKPMKKKKVNLILSEKWHPRYRARG
eukprot:CAMPEP_0206592518 /NCGR_PEP_ID=MMETSP0325_2-20121206/41015_1 /ASSEMBLY_ACC=CAM_ASM_000347 /TAXON_ID=2866 /ORGANISM="Crypthecodinium cohnii, Strain Seligo" /LENGTH=49 /DNA_ID= /DNA_START= /DNA_END= /DNA_ORIENTATION=